MRHVNGDPLDCRRENLMLRTNSQRVRNNRKMRHIQGRAADVAVQGRLLGDENRNVGGADPREVRPRRLGYFHDEIDAAEAYD